jgi:hypothetical protein
LWPIEITIRNFTVGWVKQRETQHPQHPTHPHRNIFMSKILKSIVGLAIITSTIGLAATPAQAESKTSQCQRFNQAMLDFDRQFTGVQYESGQNSTENVENLLNISETALKQLQNRKFNDPKVRALQQKALNIYGRLHNDMVDMRNGFAQGNHAAAVQGHKQYTTDLKSRSSLKQQFAAYCVR